VAGLLAIAALGIVASSVFRRSLDHRLEAGPISAPIRESVRRDASKLGATRAPAGTADSEARAVEDAVKHSFVASFRLVMGACVVLALAASACALAGIPGRRRTAAPGLSASGHGPPTSEQIGRSPSSKASRAP